MMQTILSGLALLAAMGALILAIREKKRSTKRNAALLEYLDRTLKGEVKACGDKADGLAESVSELDKRVSALENGICPDFEEAKAAAKAVNDFNSGLSAILNFDPLHEEKMRKDRLHSQRGDESWP